MLSASDFQIPSCFLILNLQSVRKLKKYCSLARNNSNSDKILKNFLAITHLSLRKFRVFLEMRGEVIGCDMGPHEFNDTPCFQSLLQVYAIILLLLGLGSSK